MTETNLAVQLSPPWYIYTNKLKNTFGLSPLVQVNDLIEVNGNYVLIINGFDNDVSLSLRQILPTTVVFGNITIYITIFNSNGNIANLIDTSNFTTETIAQMFNQALKENPIFKGTVITEDVLPENLIPTVGDIVVVIDKNIVQFFNDDINDFCQCYNEIASRVFKEISITNFSDDIVINFTTYSQNCPYIQDM